MPLNPDLPFPKSQGDNIRSKDWNDAVNEIIRLDSAKLNLAGGNLTGPLNVAGSLGIGTTAPNRPLTIQGAAGTYLNVKANGGTHEVLLGADNAGGIVSTMTNHDLQLRAGGNDTKVVIKADGKIGIEQPNPKAALHIKEYTVINEAKLSFFAALPMPFSSFGSNLYYTGAGIPVYTRIDNTKAGVCMVLNSETPGGQVNFILQKASEGFPNVIASFGTTGATIDGGLGVSGPVNVNGQLTAQKVQLGGKWSLSGVGDGHGNDDWLRLFNVANNAYYGGLAAGRLWSSSGTLSGSDARLKQDIAGLDNALDGLLALRGVRFRWRAAGGESPFQLGLLAQDVEKVFPELVETGPDGAKGINTSGLFGPLVEALKQQHRAISELRAEIAALKAGRGGGADGGGKL